MVFSYLKVARMEVENSVYSDSVVSDVWDQFNEIKKVQHGCYYRLC